MLGGMLSSIKFSHTKNPRPGSTNTKYAMFDLEDMDGTVRCILWPEEFAKSATWSRPTPSWWSAARSIAGRAAKKSNLIVNELIPLAELAGRFTKGIVVRVSEEQHAERGLEELHEILRGYPGNCELQLVLCLADGSRVYHEERGDARRPERRNARRASTPCWARATCA